MEESFGGAIDSYSFFNQASAGVIGSYVSSGTRISVPTPLIGTGGPNSTLKLWTTTDPDSTPGSGSPAIDYATTPNFTSNTMVQTYAASGSIDLTGLTTGIIYMFYRAYRNTPQFDFTMTGVGQTDVTFLDVGDNDFANHHEFYAYALYYDTDGCLYDTLDHDFSIPEVNNGRGRLDGIVIVPVPEPSTARFLWRRVFPSPLQRIGREDSAYAKGLETPFSLLGREDSGYAKGLETPFSLLGREDSGYAKGLETPFSLFLKRPDDNWRMESYWECTELLFTNLFTP